MDVPATVTLTLETHHLEEWRALAAEIGCSLEQIVALTVDDAKVAVLRAQRSLTPG